MQEGNLVGEHPLRGRARGMKRLVNEVLWNFTLRGAKRKTGPLFRGPIPSVRTIGLGVLISTLLPLLVTAYPLTQADANQLKKTVKYKPRKNWKEISTTVTMDLFGPGYADLPAGLKEKPNLYWLQISVKPTVEVDFEFDVYGHNVLKKGKGHWISASYPGEVMIAVEDQKASLGRLQKLYYRETLGYSDTKFRDYSKLATSTEEWPTDYHKKFGRYHDPDFKTVTDQLQDFWGSLKKKIPGFKESVPIANYLLGYHPVLGPTLSTLQMWPLLTEVMKTTPEWVFTTKVPGVYRDGSDEKLRDPLPVFSDDMNFDIHTYSWPFLLRSESKMAGGWAPNQISKLNYFFELHREKPEETLLYIRAIIPHHVVAAGGTPESWIEIEWEISLPALTEVPDEQRYQLITSWKTWENAKTDCEKRGGHLVTIDSDEENETVTQLLKDGGYRTAWIGLSLNNEGTWEWVSLQNLTDPSYRHWDEDPQEPTGGEYYVEIHSDGAWNDWCDNRKNKECRMPYVCEFEPIKPEEAEDKPPKVFISVTPEKVRVGETFRVFLRAEDDVGLQSMWWWGENTGIPELDKDHTARIFNTWATSGWTITATKEGTFTLAADARDSAYPAPGHQASEGEGIAKATITVTNGEKAIKTPAATAKLTFWSAFDNGKTDLSKYQVLIKLNGYKIFSGTPPSIEHATITIPQPSKNVSNFKPFEVTFDKNKSQLKRGRNKLEISLSGVDSSHWFCWDYFDLGGTEVEYTRYMPAEKHDMDHREFLGIVDYPASSGSWPYGGTGQVDGVYGGQIATVIFSY